MQYAEVQITFKTMKNRKKYEFLRILFFYIRKIRILDLWLEMTYICRPVFSVMFCDA